MNEARKDFVRGIIEDQIWNQHIRKIVDVVVASADTSELSIGIKNFRNRIVTLDQMNDKLKSIITDYKVEE